MATIRHPLVIRNAVLLALLLGAAPALAQESPSSPAQDTPSGVQDPAGPRAARKLTATGQTRPTGPAATKSSPNAPVPKPASPAEMVKAQKAAEARSKAWDTKMHRTMGSICHGC